MPFSLPASGAVHSRETGVAPTSPATASSASMAACRCRAPLSARWATKHRSAGSIARSVASAPMTPAAALAASAVRRQASANTCAFFSGPPHVCIASAIDRSAAPQGGRSAVPRPPAAAASPTAHDRCCQAASRSRRSLETSARAAYSPNVPTTLPALSAALVVSGSGSGNSSTPSAPCS